MKSEWKKCKIGDCVEFNPKECLYKGTYAKKVSMENLLPYSKAINGYEFEYYSGGAKFRNNDTIMARITPCLENGKTAFVDILNDDEIAFGSTEYIVWRAKSNFFSEFLYYLVISPYVREKAIKSMVGSSGRQRVQIDVIKNLEITLPPLPTQKKIAAILSALDAKIENNNAINRNLEQQAQALFKSWFVDFEPFGGKMPEGWREYSLCEIADFIGGYSYTGKELKDYSEIGMTTIKNFERNGGSN